MGTTRDTWRSKLVRWGTAPISQRLYNKAYKLAISSDLWGESEIEAFHDRQLRDLVHFAGTRIPFYRKLYADAAIDVENFRGLEDFGRLPYVTREDLQLHANLMTARGILSGNTVAHDTGGTTSGHKGTVFMYRGTHQVEAGFIGALWKRAGARHGDCMAVLRGELTQDWDTFWQYDEAGNRLVFSSYQMNEVRAREYISLMKRYGAEWIHAYPSSVWLFGTILQRYGIEFDVPLKGILLGSESIPPGQADALAAIFGCRVFAHYGHREMCLLAGWCEHSQEYHFVPPYGYMEYRPTLVGSPMGDRPLMELVGTGYINRFMPLIRYATGDFADPAPRGACPGCGRFHPRAAMLHGRGQNFLVAADGRVVPQNNADIHSYELASRYQFRQDTPGKVKYCFIPADPARKLEAAAQLQKEFDSWTRLGLEVTVEVVEELPRTWAGKDIQVRQSLRMPWEAS